MNLMQPMDSHFPWAGLANWRGIALTANLPRITVVTPSFNQAPYLEATIRSVLGQGYPNLEYFVMDGGSTDGSREIIERFSPWLSGWVCERDRGQTDAITKGLQRATGEWFNWINSDDLLAPAALWKVAAAALSGTCDAVAGTVQEFDGEAEGRTVAARRISARELLFEPEGGVSWHQPGIWLRTRPLKEIGLPLDLHYRFDFALYIRYLHRHPQLTILDDTLAYFRLHAGSKTVSQQACFHEERLRVLHALSIDESLGTLSGDASLALRRWQWFDRLDRLVADTQRSRLARMLDILRAAHQDPAGRHNRQTRKALRRILMRGGSRPGSGSLGGGHAEH